MRVANVVILLFIGLMTTCVYSAEVASIIFVEDWNYGYGQYTSCYAYVSGWWDIDAGLVILVHHDWWIRVPALPGWGGRVRMFPGEGGSAPHAYTHVQAGYWIHYPYDLWVDSEALAWIPEIP
jgi:hypothetical protein